MKIIVSHPTGNENSKQLGKSFEENRNLKYFITAINFNIDKFPLTFLPNKIKKELNRRNFSKITNNLLITNYWKELLRIILTKLNINLFNLLKQETGVLSIDKIYESVDKYTAKIIDKYPEINKVYSYEKSSYYTFLKAKQKGIICIYDLPTGYWRMLENINKEEKILNPEWSFTLQGVNDSEYKLKKKDEELKLADIIIVASSFTKKSLEYYPNKLSEIKVIPYGFPEAITEKDRDWYNGKRKLRVLYVGGLKQSKGLSYLCEVINYFNRKIDFNMIGTGPGLKLIESKLKNNFNYLGSLPHNEVLDHMKNNDVLVFPSLFDGFGMVITEAMSRGMVVISTDRTGLKDISDEKSAICVPHSNSKVIIESIELLIKEPNLVKQIGTEALKRASEYQWKDYRNKIKELLAHE